MYSRPPCAAWLAALFLCGALPAQGLPPSESCCDGVDNDGDGKVDIDDLDCIHGAPCYSSRENCCNWRDDNGDGKTDTADLDCATFPDKACHKCPRAGQFEVFFGNGAGQGALQEGAIAWEEGSTLTIRGRSPRELHAFELGVARMDQGSDHLYEFSNRILDDAAVEVPLVFRFQGGNAAPGAANRLVTPRRIVSIEAGHELGWREKFLSHDMDPIGVDGFWVRYDASAFGRSGNVAGVYDSTQCEGVELLRLVFESASRPAFLRGDADGNGSRNVTDAVHILDWLFRRGEPPACEASADANDDDRIQVTDAIFLFGWLFIRAPEDLPAPWWHCGEDPTPGERGCEVSTGC